MVMEGETVIIEDDWQGGHRRRSSLNAFTELDLTIYSPVCTKPAEVINVVSFLTTSCFVSTSTMLLTNLALFDMTRSLI